MRLERNEAIEQRLHHIGPLFLMRAAAGAEIVQRETSVASFLDLMPAMRREIDVADRRRRESKAR